VLESSIVHYQTILRAVRLAFCWSGFVEPLLSGFCSICSCILASLVAVLTAEFSAIAVQFEGRICSFLRAVSCWLLL
jgi:hypothetical protein